MNDDVLAVVHRAAVQLEAIAESVEFLIADTTSTRHRVLDVAAPAADDVGIIGSLDALESELLREFGFDRIEAARRRIALAVHDPIDDLDRWFA